MRSRRLALCEEPLGPAVAHKRTERWTTRSTGDPFMRTRNTIFAAAAIVALGARSKTPEGNIVVDNPTCIAPSPDTLHPPTITTKTDTINTPTVGTKPETLIVNRPIVGTKKTEIKVPVIRKKP